MRYRYRNLVLVGRWFEDREAAINDAIRAGQVRRTADGELKWVDHGQLEEDADGHHQVVRPRT